MLKQSSDSIAPDKCEIAANLKHDKITVPLR